MPWPTSPKGSSVPNLQDTAAALVAEPKGILAADESTATMSKRLAAAGIPANETTRRDFRALLLTTPGIASWVAGIIWCDETIHQHLPDGTPWPEACRQRGIHAGVKVDTGLAPLPGTPGAVVTEGLDGLSGRLAYYRRLGATFAKWRAVLDPANLPPIALHANAHALARYAIVCQEEDVVPIVEPEVLMDGSHGIHRCLAATTAALTAVFDELELMGVDLSAVVLKPNMVVDGADHQPPATAEEVARATLAVLRSCVPAAVPGVAFLSGGQPNDRACTNLAAINRMAVATGPVPWRLTFSFGRALVHDALHTWRGDPHMVDVAQQVLADHSARAAAATAALAGVSGA